MKSRGVYTIKKSLEIPKMQRLCIYDEDGNFVVGGSVTGSAYIVSVRKNMCISEVRVLPSGDIELVEGFIKTEII